VDWRGGWEAEGGSGGVPPLLHPLDGRIYVLRRKEEEGGRRL